MNEANFEDEKKVYSDLFIGESGFFLPTGFDTEGLGPAVFHGGEAEALTRLERHLERKVTATDFILY